ncbi:MAG: ATP-binding cassette domain-containing protein [Clostridiaceae bacterium]|nr:ATP-binding cassette domain-containing protein [Clostridiaceae bacterium]
MLAEHKQTEFSTFASGRLVHEWGQRFRLDIADLQILPRTSYAILGANGSGKSTLLRLLAARMLENDQFSEPGAIGYLPQTPYSFRLTVEENVRLGIAPELGLSTNEQNEIIISCLDSLGLLHLRSEPGHKLSGGEAQRMALARLMTVKRRVLLLDEPTGALDLQGLSLAERAISDYLKTSDCTLMLVTHQLSLAERLCEQLIFLNNGKLEAAGPLMETLRSKPTASLSQYLHFEKSVCLSESTEGMA